MIHHAKIVRCTAVTSGLILSLTLPSGLARAQSAATGPTIKLVVAQKNISVPLFGKGIELDPGVYVAAFGSQLRFDVQRASYSKPLTITQIINVPGAGTVDRPLSRKMLDGWNGLSRFLRVTVKNSSGKTVASRIVSFCPNSFNTQRADPNAPGKSPFPQLCEADPFPLGMVWGIQRGWGVDPIGNGYSFNGLAIKAKRGYYTATVDIISAWRKLDVEGFRVNGSSTMRAYQYFWHDGLAVGRERVGTMGFSGYNHWHFKQFAQYRLLNAKKNLVLRSQKEGFCIGASDPINLLLPRASWNPGNLEISNDCSQESALWTQEMLPVGWGDTYFQFLPGQSFNITNLPNGKYFIQIIANPGHQLHETSTRNDTSLREIIVGGTAGHRTVRVPAYFGIDPEN